MCVMCCCIDTQQKHGNRSGNFSSAFENKSYKNAPMCLAIVSPVVLSFPIRDNSRTSEGIFMKFDIGGFYYNMRTHSDFDQYRTKRTNTLHNDLRYTSILTCLTLKSIRTNSIPYNWIKKCYLMPAYKLSDFFFMTNFLPKFWLLIKY